MLRSIRPKRATATPVFEIGPAQRAHAEKHAILYDELLRRALIQWGLTRFVEAVPYRRECARGGPCAPVIGPASVRDEFSRRPSHSHRS